MKRRDFRGSSLALAGLSAVRFPPARGALVSRVRPGMPGWPGEADWAQLKRAVGDRLVPVTISTTQQYTNCSATRSISAISRA